MIRRATAGDVAGIVRLWREMWDFNAALDPRMTATPVANPVMTGWIEDHLERERSLVLVAQDGNDLVGYGLATILENPPVVPHQFYGYVSELSVTASHRRSGVGSLLLENIQAWFHEKGMPYAEVTASVRNELARGFWRKQGYGDFVERLRRDFQ